MRRARMTRLTVTANSCTVARAEESGLAIRAPTHEAPDGRTSLDRAKFGPASARPTPPQAARQGRLSASVTSWRTRSRDTPSRWPISPSVFGSDTPLSRPESVATSRRPGDFQMAWAVIRGKEAEAWSELASSLPTRQVGL
jgi:hypothetical protein